MPPKSSSSFRMLRRFLTLKFVCSKLLLLTNNRHRLAPAIFWPYNALPSGYSLRTSTVVYTTVTMTAYPHKPFDDMKPQTAKPLNEAKLRRKKQLEGVWKRRAIIWARMCQKNGKARNFSK
jgi:hypothetical protein